jgi:hypothetical protein
MTDTMVDTKDMLCMLVCGVRWMCLLSCGCVRVPGTACVCVLCGAWCGACEYL